MTNQTRKIVVQKYGGTSLGSIEKIRLVAQRIIAAKTPGIEVVVVVSAMGKTTDELLALAASVGTDEASRELDLLLSTGETVSATLMALALQSAGADAIALTGEKAGISTSADPGRGEIVDIDRQRVLAVLDSGMIPVITGFQGVNEHGDIVTLGRGGSDTTAVAIAAALGAERCEIYTDVDGVMSTDPRVMPEAQILTAIDYQEMLELSSSGAKVMHPRAVELGERQDMPIWVGSTFGSEAGTRIERVSEAGKRKVQGISFDRDVAKITLLQVPDRAGIAASVFSALATQGINVDIVVQNVSHNGTTDVSFTIAQSDIERTRDLLASVVTEIGAAGVMDTTNLAKVSVVGSGIRGTPGVFAAAFAALAEQGINIEMISTSEIYLACIIEQRSVHEAVRALHEAFGLEKPE